MKLSVLNISMSLPDLNPAVYRDENEKVSILMFGY